MKYAYKLAQQPNDAVKGELVEAIENVEIDDSILIVVPSDTNTPNNVPVPFVHHQYQYQPNHQSQYQMVHASTSGQHYQSVQQIHPQMIQQLQLPQLTKKNVISSKK